MRKEDSILKQWWVWVVFGIIFIPGLLRSVTEVRQDWTKMANALTKDPKPASTEPGHVWVTGEVVLDRLAGMEVIVRYSEGGMQHVIVRQDKSGAELKLLNQVGEAEARFVDRDTVAVAYKNTGGFILVQYSGLQAGAPRIIKVWQSSYREGEISWSPGRNAMVTYGSSSLSYIPLRKKEWITSGDGFKLIGGDCFNRVRWSENGHWLGFQTNSAIQLYSSDGEWQNFGAMLSPQEPFFVTNQGGVISEATALGDTSQLEGIDICFRRNDGVTVGSAHYEERNN
jgi:hypothetical protein